MLGGLGALPARPRRLPLAQRPPLQLAARSSPRSSSLALIPLAVEIPSIATLAIATAVMIAMIVYELWRFREFRDRLRHGLPIHPEREPAETPSAATDASD